MNSYATPRGCQSNALHVGFPFFCIKRNGSNTADKDEGIQYYTLEKDNLFSNRRWKDLQVLRTTPCQFASISGEYAVLRWRLLNLAPLLMLRFILIPFTAGKGGKYHDGGACRRKWSPSAASTTINISGECWRRRRKSVHVQLSKKCHRGWIRTRAEKSVGQHSTNWAIPIACQKWSFLSYMKSLNRSGFLKRFATCKLWLSPKDNSNTGGLTL